ncbi:MAG: PIN domain-containing protein [Chloroflexota bacterium]|nr:PIN domain-containing protein [Chloroflexota bacterium]
MPMTHAPAARVPSAVVVDTSAWVSRLLTQDSNHPAAVTWINQHLLSGGFLISPILLVTETAAAVSRVTGVSARGHIAASRLYTTPEMILVQIDQALVDEATDLAAGLRLRGADSYYVAVARRLGLALVTFDSEQLSRAAPVIATIRP